MSYGQYNHRESDSSPTTTNSLDVLSLRQVTHGRKRILGSGRRSATENYLPARIPTSTKKPDSAIKRIPPVRTNVVRSVLPRIDSVDEGDEGMMEGIAALDVKTSDPPEPESSGVPLTLEKSKQTHEEQDHTDNTFNALMNKFATKPNQARRPLRPLPSQESVNDSKQPDNQGHSSMKTPAAPRVSSTLLSASSLIKQRSHGTSLTTPNPKHHKDSFTTPGNRGVTPRNQTTVPNAAATSSKKAFPNSRNNLTTPTNAARSSVPSSSVRQHHRSATESAQPSIPTPSAIAGFMPLQTPGANAGFITVNGKQYQKCQEIGRGGSSKVYEVFDGKKMLALKRVNLTNADESQIEGYKNEIKMLQKLQGHDCIVRLIDYELREDDDLLFVVMEKGDTDLSKLLKKAAVEKDWISIKCHWKKMLEVVKVIHEEGIIHSDLKPANFILVKGNLKLIDFGIASAVQTEHTSVLKCTQEGTINYMSPEALQDLAEDGANAPKIKISYKSDVWSLGCILYSMVYGRMPFGHLRHIYEKIEAIRNPNQDIIIPTEGVDPLLVDVISRCLVRDVQKRASVDELLDHQYLKADVETKLLGGNLMQFQSLLENELQLTPNTKQGIAKAIAEKFRKNQV